MSLEEVTRRVLVAAAKQAGTLIRKQELRRQAMVAKINKPLVQATLDQLRILSQKFPDPSNLLRSGIQQAISQGKPILETALSSLMQSMLQAIPSIISGELDKLEDLFNQANLQIQTANKIISELSSQGMHIPPLGALSYKDTWDLISKLGSIQDRLRTVLEFYQVLEQYSEEAG